MADDYRPSQPIPPGSRVAVFLDEGASGATLGYYGTLVGVCQGTMRRNPNNRGLWQYSIHVSALGRTIHLEANKFLVTRTVDGHEQLRRRPKLLASKHWSNRGNYGFRLPFLTTMTSYSANTASASASEVFSIFGSAAKSRRPISFACLPGRMAAIADDSPIRCQCRRY